MTNEVRPRNSTSSASWMSCSVAVSTLAVASSRIRIHGSASKCPREGHELALAVREGGAALVDDRIVAEIEALDEVMHVHGAGCGFNLFLRGVEPAVADIVTDGAAEEERLL